MREQFIEWKPSMTSGAMIEVVRMIMGLYAKQGLILSLRQLYYQAVARDLLPYSWADKSGSTNNINSYKRLMHIVKQGRLSGMIDWAMIEDRVRGQEINDHWNTPQKILDYAANYFYIERWKNLDDEVFVLSEKDAVSNIIRPICEKWDVTFMANRGYLSLTAKYDLYKKFLYLKDSDKRITILYVGDHDPSGLDMDRDIDESLAMFFLEEMAWEEKENFDFIRIALTMPQIEKYNPPENPTKITDTRSNNYIRKHGNSSWELDALEPAVLQMIVEEMIKVYVDQDEFDRIEKDETEIKAKLTEFVSNWED